MIYVPITEKLNDGHVPALSAKCVYIVSLINTYFNGNHYIFTYKELKDLFLPYFNRYSTEGFLTSS